MSKKRNAEMAKQAYGTVMDMGHVVRAARLASGLKVDYIAQCMNTTHKEWVWYEQNHAPIPGHIIIRLMIFGMDFWARNKQCFENMSNDHPVPACAGMTNAHPSTTGELGSQVNN